MRKLAPKWAAAAICLYEVLSITTGRTPTVTALCGRYRLLGPVLVVALAVHLYRDPGLPAVPRPAGDCPVCPVAF